MNDQSLLWGLLWGLGPALGSRVCSGVCSGVWGLLWGLLWWFRVFSGGLGTRSDGGLGEGHLEVVVGPHVVVVEVHEPLDGLFHRRHLEQRHLVVPGERGGVEG